MKNHRSNLNWSLWGAAGILALLFLLPLIIPGDGLINLGFGFDVKTVTAMVFLPALFFVVGYRTNLDSPPDWFHLFVLTLTYLLAMLMITRGHNLSTIGVFMIYYIVSDVVGSLSGRSKNHNLTTTDSHNKSTQYRRNG